MTGSDHPIIVSQGANGILTVSAPLCAADRVTFAPNAVVVEADFAAGSCVGFRARVLGIWGRGGPRSLVPRVAKCRRCGGTDCTCGVGARLVPEDRRDPAAGVGGAIVLGRRGVPLDAVWEPEG